MSWSSPTTPHFHYGLNRSSFATCSDGLKPLEIRFACQVINMPFARTAKSMLSVPLKVNMLLMETEKCFGNVISTQCQKARLRHAERAKC